MNIECEERVVYRQLFDSWGTKEGNKTTTTIKKNEQTNVVQCT